MDIIKQSTGTTLSVALVGRLDAVTAIQLDSVLKSSLQGVQILTFDLKDLIYIASAGLRILLKYQKLLDKAGGEMTIRNVRVEVREVLDMTGFSDFLHIVDSPSKVLSIEF